MTEPDRARAARRRLVADPPVAVCPDCGEFFGWIPDDIPKCLNCRFVDCLQASVTAFRALGGELSKYDTRKSGKDERQSFP